MITVSEAAIALLCGIEGNRTACEEFLSLASVLMASPECPKVTESTVMLLKGLSMEGDEVTKKALLALSIVRYVDLLSSLNTSFLGKSVASIATEYNCPEELVDLRHHIVHRDFPSLNTLIYGATLALEHVVGIFWVKFVSRELQMQAADPIEVFDREFQDMLSLLSDVRTSLNLTPVEEHNVEPHLLSSYFSSALKSDAKLVKSGVPKFEAFWLNWRNVYFPQFDEKAKTIQQWLANAEQTQWLHVIDLMKNYLLFSNFDSSFPSLLIKFVVFNLLMAAPNAFLDSLASAVVDQLHLLLKTKSDVEALCLLDDHKLWCSNHGGLLDSGACFCGVQQPIQAVHNLVSWITFLIEPDPRTYSHLERDKGSDGVQGNLEFSFRSTTLMVLALSQRPQMILRLSGEHRAASTPEDHRVIRDITAAIGQLQTRLTKALAGHFLKLSSIYVNLISKNGVEERYASDSHFHERIWKILGIVQSNRSRVAGGKSNALMLNEMTSLFQKA